MRVNRPTGDPLLPGEKPIETSREAPHTEEPRSRNLGERQVSPEFAELVAQLKEIPDVRIDVVSDIERRLNSGELLSREAAEATAEALLSDFESILRPEAEA